ncbi:MAG: dihydroxyacetone kinase subunit DhaK [Spirochaetia bacterium]|jgi:dihydroxyacetone kinase-like protein|nr:dihydroxyacetone kinase subunit DhaK [Spirochaetia bacterium]
MKKLINSPDSVVKDSLHGMQSAHPDILKIFFDPDFIIRADAPLKGKTAVVSGGGSGHEPMHGGFVGHGMLHGACPGDVFTSPTPDQILAAVKAVDGGAGVLAIVKNYSGDVMNFEMAAELASDEGIKTASVVINDDVAVKDSLYTQGRRGVGATVFAEKICGAASERGYDLKQITDLCQAVNANSRSMGMSLTSCTVPAAGKPTFQIAENEIEIGIGIHGEPGRERIPLKKASEIAGMMMDAITGDLPFKNKDRVILMLNGMGGTPLIELYLLYNEVFKIAASKGIIISRKLVGNYITSLDMQGFSITLLRVNDEMLKLWDDPVLTPALRWGM